MRLSIKEYSGSFYVSLKENLLQFNAKEIGQKENINLKETLFLQNNDAAPIHGGSGLPQIGIMYKYTWLWLWAMHFFVYYLKDFI